MTVVELPRPVRVAPSLLRPLASPADPALIGGKATALGTMLRAGIPVPEGFVVTSKALDAQLSSIGEVSDAVLSERVRDARLPPELRDELAFAAGPLLATGPVVVRSSAVGEDGVADSFAGQLDSILHVRDQESLERAVAAVWSSLWSERALFYRKARDVAERGMGVVVQRQVDARAAGVLFTSTTAGEMLVEYAPGLADGLVSGVVDPGRLTIDRASGAVRHLARCDTALDPTALEELRQLGLRLEAELGGPQDVEWALDQTGTVFIVQSRPITAPVVVRSTVPPLTRSTVWSNANVNENFPRPISPLLFSIASAGYTHYFRNLAVAFGVSKRRVRAMEPAFQQIIGTHGARMYYNLTSIHSVLRLAPFGKALAASFDTFVGADGSSVEIESAHTGRLEQFVEVGVIAFKASRLFLTLDERIARFERTVDDFAARTTPHRLESMSLEELRAALAEFIEIRCHKWLDASLADAASMICYGALERLLVRAYPNGAVHTSLLKAIPDVVSGEPVLRLWDLSRLIRNNPALEALVESASPADVVKAIEGDERFAVFRAAFQRYLDDWGFRCSEELILTSPSFQENPEPLVEILRTYARLEGNSPRDALRAQTAERERETRRVMSELSPTHAALLEWLLPRTHAAIRYRERARLKQALLYSRCRRIVLAMGAELVLLGTIAERDDVFFFTHSELLVPPSGDVRELVAARKAEHARLSATTPPDSFTLADGETIEDLHQPEVRPSTGALRGTPACGGKVTARATVLRDVTESGRLERGDILVTKQTDPGWGPVFFLISGLVIERGGMLSHGAIIAREFGIPCVVGIKNAMERIATGATITVDGDTGVVHVVD